MKACFIPERPACCNALLSTARRSRRAVYGRYQNRVNQVCATGAGGFQPAAPCSASEARTAGARLKPSCAVLGITAHTWQRWTQGGAVRADGRPTALRPAPSHALTEDERQAVLETTPRQARRPLCSPIQPALSAVAGPLCPACGRQTPGLIVPRLADQGVYLPACRRQGCRFAESRPATPAPIIAIFP